MGTNDDHEVECWGKVYLDASEGLSELSLHAYASNRAANLASDREATPRMIQLIGYAVHEQGPRLAPMSSFIDLFKLSLVAQSKGARKALCSGCSCTHLVLLQLPLVLTHQAGSSDEPEDKVGSGGDHCEALHVIGTELVKNNVQGVIL